MVIKLRFRLVFPVIILLLLVFTSTEIHAAKKNIGVIMTGEIAYYKLIHKAFVATLKEKGVVPENADVLLQTPAPSPVPWMNAARKFVVYDVDVIVSYGAPATLAVLDETSDIPVIFAGVYDNEAVGIRSKNATGINSKVPIVTVIKHLKSIVPFHKLGIILNTSERDTMKQAEEIKGLEDQFDFRSRRFNIKNPDDASRISGVDALFMTSSCIARQCAYNIKEIAHRAKIPIVSIMGGGDESGAILTISADPEEQGRVAAEMVIRILNGEDISSLPVQRPRKIEMIINLKEASAIGLKVPIDVLTSATRLIK
jgi:putative ABC transport system substrate-binding protein